MFLLNYLAAIMPVFFSAYQAGFYMISPIGWVPYVSAKYNLNLPGF